MGFTKMSRWFIIRSKIEISYDERRRIKNGSSTIRVRIERKQKRNFTKQYWSGKRFDNNQDFLITKTTENSGSQIKMNNHPHPPPLPPLSSIPLKSTFPLNVIITCCHFQYTSVLSFYVLLLTFTGQHKDGMRRNQDFISVLPSCLFFLSFFLSSLSLLTSLPLLY